MTNPAQTHLIQPLPLNSTDLVNWLPPWTNTLAGPLNFSDPPSGVSAKRFYRALTK